MLRKLLPILPLLLILLECGGSSMASKQRLIETGNKYFKIGKYKEASIIYRRAIQKDRRFGEAYYRLGLVDLRLGRIRPAIGALTRATELQPENEDAYARLTDLYLAIYLSNPAKNQRYLGEIQTLTNRAQQYFPDSFQVNRIRGFVELSRKNYTAAIGLFRRAVKQKPDDARVNAGLVRSLAAAGRNQEAEALAKSYIEKHKSYGPMYNTLYIQYLREHRLDDALAVLKQKCANNPKQITYRLQLARHYYLNRNRAAMVAVLDEIVSNPKQFPTAYADVGRFYFQIREFDRTIELYRKGAAELPKQAVSFQIKIADVLAIQGKQQEAYRLVESILAKDKENSKALAMRGALRLHSGDKGAITSAISDFESALTHMPDNVVLRYNLAEAYRALGNTDRAIVEYRAAIQKRPDYLPPRYSLARIYLRKHDFAKAVAGAEEILSLRPKDLTARLIRSNAWIGLGQKQRARKSLEQILKERPRTRAAAYHLARLDILDKRYGEAEVLFRRLDEASPPDPRGLFGLAEVYMLQHHPQQAAKLVRARIKKEPDNLSYHLALANILTRTKHYDGAIAEIQKVLAKRPDDGKLQRRLGGVYYRAGRMNEAEQHFKKAAELLPKDPICPLYLGMLSELRGAPQQAAGYYERTLELKPDNPIALNNLAYILAETTADLDRALTLVQRARSLVPENPDIADTLAWVYIKKNLPDSALPILKQILTKRPADANWRYHLGMALYQKGEKAQAKKELETALRNSPTKKEAGKIHDLLSRIGS